MVCNDLIRFAAVRIICKYAKTCILLKNFWTLNVMMAQNLLANWEMCRKFGSPYNLSYPVLKFVPIIGALKSSLPLAHPPCSCHCHPRFRGLWHPLIWTESAFIICSSSYIFGLSSVCCHLFFIHCELHTGIM
jgi:hypothetical protein